MDVSQLNVLPYITFYCHGDLIDLINTEISWINESYSSSFLIAASWRALGEMITGIYSKEFMHIKSSGVFKLKTNHIFICSFRLHDADILTMNLGPCSDRHNNIDRVRHRNKSSLINRKGSDVATCWHLGNVNYHFIRYPFPYCSVPLSWAESHYAIYKRSSGVKVRLRSN